MSLPNSDPLQNDRVVHEIPNQASIGAPNEANPDRNLGYISDWIKKKKPKTACEVLRCALMAFATKMESVHKAEMLAQGTPQTPPPAIALGVKLDRRTYGEIKQEAITQLRSRLTPQVDGDQNDSSDTGNHSVLTAGNNAQEEIKDMPMPLFFDFLTPNCTQVLNVRLVVPRVFLDLVGEELKQMDLDQKRTFSLDDLAQLGRTKSELFSVNYDRMLRNMMWIRTVQRLYEINWEEFPLIQEALRDPNFGKTPDDVVPPPPLQLQTCEVVFGGSRKRKARFQLHKGI